jgi:parvulin-like peptidyl-prolyl isomerase
VPPLSFLLTVDRRRHTACGVRPLLLVSFLIAAAACARTKSETKSSDAGSSTAAPSSAQIVARVNEVPITELDLQLRSKPPSGHTGAPPPASGPALLETVIRDELIRQRAAELGLDRDPGYQKKLQEMEAGLAAFKRREMTELFLQREINDKAAVSEQEAREYFEQHARDIRSELHVMQLLFNRDEAAARAASDEIKRGASFEEVAERRFVGLPENVKAPWDLGSLKWNQIPEAWWGVIFQMKPGDVSDVVSGEGRHWVLKLVARRELADASFDEVKPRIESVLRRKKVEERRAAVLEELRKKADVVYEKPLAVPGPAPQPTEE